MWPRLTRFFCFSVKFAGPSGFHLGDLTTGFNLRGAPHAVPVKSKKKLVRKKMSISILIDICIGLVFQKAGIRSQDGEK